MIVALKCQSTVNVREITTNHLNSLHLINSLIFLFCIMEDMDNNQVKVFKIILEYFVQHIDYLCDVKNNPVEEDKSEQEHQDENKKRKKIIIKGSRLAFVGDAKLNTDESVFTKSGQGYNDNSIQTQMENYIQKQIKQDNGVKNSQEFNSFTCPNNGQQKICISIDASIGFIGGSYLHLLSVDKDGPAGTNINPVFTTEEKNNEITKEFVGLEVGPSKSHPEYVFPRLQFSFTELGLSDGNPNDYKQANLQMFLDYFLEMRKAELSRKDNSLTTRGYDQLLATQNMILTGAPGTGKTWAAKNIASWMICDMSYSKLKEFDDKNTIFNSCCKLVQFHPSYDYTDFVEGLRPMKKSGGNNEIGFELTNGVFKKFCEEALKNQNKENPKTPPYVFIIDEINRGELSKIFGELFYSIDPGYRGTNGAVLTQYANMVGAASVFDQKLGFFTNNTPPPGTPDDEKVLDAGFSKDFQPKMNEEPTHSNQIISAASEGANKQEFGNFFVPENVYIIGTMNDIDRSVDSMDFAMRRRFSFIEVKANERMDIWTGKDWGDLAAACMIAINNEIDKIPGLNSSYHVGPAYFKKLDDYNKEYPDFFKLWDNHLHGVLFEYLRGKKDAKGTINTIQNSYLKALVKAINSRFNVSGKWGESLIKKCNSASTLNANIKDIDSAKDYLKNIKGEIKFDDNLLSDSINREEEINKMRIMIKRHMDIGKKIMNLPKQEV